MKRKMMQVLLIISVGCAMALTGCSGRTAVNFNVHTEPEGAHVIYMQNNSPWIYLGVTPLDVIEVLEADQLENDDTITLKAMRCGYLEQAKEWSGEELQKETVEKGQIFWTPRLIKDIE